MEGKIQIEGEVIHIVVKRCSDISGLLQKANRKENKSPELLTLSGADEKDFENYAIRDRRVQQDKSLQTEIFHGGRNFR